MKITKWARALVLPVILVGTAVTSDCAHAQFGNSMSPQWSTLRFSNTEADMVWTVQLAGEKTSEWRIHASGCAAGKGQLVILDNGGDSAPIPWHGKGKTEADRVGRTTCWASRPLGGY